MSFQMVPLHGLACINAQRGFGTMSFQMVPLPEDKEDDERREFWNYVIPDGSTTEVPLQHHA